MAIKIDVARQNKLTKRFQEAFGSMPSHFFSSPGRSELGGNHTDHQGGHIVACAINLDILAAVKKREDTLVHVISEGMEPFCVDFKSDVLSPHGTSDSIVQGVGKIIEEMGYPLQGFDLVCDTTIPVGAGLSSSASFEVLIGQIFNTLYCKGDLRYIQLAQIGQKAENVYFGKPSGLMDQMACASGGVIGVDFGAKVPLVTQIQPDFQGYCLCITDVGSSHANLTPAYAAIPGEMGAVAAYFGKKILSEIPPMDFFNHLKDLKGNVPDRAICRAIHYFNEDARAVEETQALIDGNLEGFMDLVRASGHSSAVFLQNAYAFTEDQPITIALGMSESFLGSRGVTRVHGGGFAGTIQAWVKEREAMEYQQWMSACGTCHILQVRNEGAICIE